MDPADARLRVTVTDGRGRRVRAPGLAAWLMRIAPKAAAGDIGIALVTDARIRSINKQFRRKDAVTDVLSFSADVSAGPATAARELGDIVIATGMARRQARDQGHTYGAELKILALHGLLHLLGYDHHSPTDLGRMARLERRLRTKGGLTAGLIERAGRVRVRGSDN